MSTSRRFQLLGLIAAAVIALLGLGVAAVLRAGAAADQTRAQTVEGQMVALLQGRAAYEHLRLRLRRDARVITRSCSPDNANTALFGALANLGAGIIVRSTDEVSQGAAVTPNAAPGVNANGTKPANAEQADLENARLDVMVTGHYPDIVRALTSLAGNSPAIGGAVEQITRDTAHDDLVSMTVRASLLQPSPQLCAAARQALREASR